ncbi:kinetochore scaffold 1 isoform X2 [Ornithorhynchus anatinus]|uniref:kinetochore scaffold 1 isoform X2 n=1 Tax=Ornithorhynchus anatinus TaxID=9258 RepID=UPI0010A942B8|nr:kinetochore scaffold 1 isoform X2 [Ornithorhynchus anatinus]
MDTIYSEAMEEKELTLPTQRRSSILKVPRSPLRDLRSGNEIIQDIGATKGRKSSRRVSFAETIKVFQRSPDSNSEEQPEDLGKTAEEGENIPLSQKERPEDMLCEISGMDTLLNAPIQAPLQQTEGPTGGSAYGDRPADDRTVVFADENQMDLTASHTVMISQGLLERTEESKKIDTKSFLASLKDNTTGSERSESCGFSPNPNEAADEYVLQVEPNLPSDKKFNFSDLLSRLRPGQPTNAPGNGPDTENTLTSLPSGDPGSDVCLLGQEDGSYRTRLFSEQDDGMDMTQHHTAVIQTFGPPGSEALLKPGECRGGTFGGPEDFMDLTVNQTGPIFSFGHEPSDRENWGSEVPVGLTSNPGVCGILPQDPSPEDLTEMDITRSHTVVIDNHTMPQATGGPAPTWPSTAFPGAWAIFDASPKEASENPVSFSAGAVSKNPLGSGQSYPKMPPKTEQAVPASSGPIQKPLPLGGRLAVSSLDAAEEMERTKSHTVAISLQDVEEATSQKAGSQTEAPLDARDLEKEEALEDPGAGIPSRRPPSSDATGRDDVEVTTSQTLDINSRVLKPALKGSSRGPEQLRKSLALSSSTSSSARGFAFLEAQQNLGRPKSHPTVTDLGTGPALPKGDDTVPPSKICKPLSGLPNRALVTPDSLDKDFTQSQAGPIKQDGFGLDFRQAQPTANSEKTISTVPEHSSWPKKMPSKRASIAKPPATEKTQEFSEGDMELTRCHTTSVEGKNVLGGQRAIRTNPPGLVDKTVVFADDLDDLELTRSHTVNIDLNRLEKTAIPDKSTSEVGGKTGLAEPKAASTGSDKTIFFLEDDQGDMEITKGLTVTLGGRSFLLGEPQESGSLPLAAEKTVVFSDDLDDLELTRSHTVNIDFKTLEKMTIPDKSMAEVFRRPGLPEPVVLIPGSDKTIFFSEDDEDDMDITQRHSDPVDGKNFVLSEWQETGMLPLPTEKTVVFSDDLDDLELTRSHTVNIDFKILEKTVIPDKSASELVRRTGLAEPVVLSSGSDGTVFFSEDDEGDMEITKGHTIMGDGKIILTGEQQESGMLTVPAEKTVVFADHLDDLELTRSHTVKIDYQNLEKTVIPDKSMAEVVRGKGLAQPKAMSTGSDQTIFFSGDGESDMEITQRHTDPVSGKSVLLGKQQESGILTAPAEKTVVFADDLNDLELTRSHTVNIDFKILERTTIPDKSTAEVDRTGLTEPEMASTGSDKTIFFSGDGEGDMEITQRHTDTVSDKSSLPGEQQGSGIPTAPAEKTVVFADDPDDLELTRSHTVNIDFKIPERTTVPERSTAEVGRAGSAQPKMMSASSDKTIFFSGDGESDMEITQRHTDTVGGKSVLLGKQQESGKLTVPAEKTVVFSDNLDDLELTRSHTVNIDFKIPERSMIPDKSTAEVDRRAGLAEPRVASALSDKTVFLSGVGSDAVGITRRHSVLPGERRVSGVVPAPAEEAVVFSANLDGLEPTSSHPADPGYETLEKMRIQDKCSSEGNWRKSLTGPKTEPPPDDSPRKCHTLALGQDLEKVVKPKSKRVSFKLPEGRSENLPAKAGESQGKETPEDDVFFTSPPPPGLEEKRHDVSGPKASKPPGPENGNPKGPVGERPVAACENESQMFRAAQEPDSLGERKGKENVPAHGGDSAGGDSQTKSDPPTQMDPIPSSASQLPEPAVPSETSGITNIKVQLRKMKRKSEVISPPQTDPKSNVPEQSSTAAQQADDYVPAAKSRDHPSTSSKTSPGDRPPSKGKTDPRDADPPGAGSASAQPVLKEKSKVGRHSLWVFLPKLPNRRNCSVTGVEGPEERPEVLYDQQFLDSQPSTSQAGNFAFFDAQTKLSPTGYISEEFLPGAPEETDSLEAWEEMGLRESPSRHDAVQEASSSHKRSRPLEDADKHLDKKVRKTRSSSVGAAESHQAEDQKGKSSPGHLAKSLSRTPASCSSSLDSTKAEGSSMDFSMQRSSHMESQFSRDSMCEESLKEKLKDGRITVGEFFTLLQVHILIQKPRQSKLPGNYALNAPSSPEDLFMSQYVYRPKIQVYEEDCQALRQTIEELKLCTKSQDKLLVDVNRSLWEVMRGCSDEELKTFGEDLNKMKSRFTKKSKLLAHQRKVALYSKLVQSSQLQWEKLQSGMERTDSMLEEADSCLAVLQIETEILEQCEEDASPDSDSDMEWKCGMRAVKQELESLQSQEEELLRTVADLKREKQQALSTMSLWQEETKRAEKWISKLTFSEWEIKEWNNQQASFTFLYDSLDLTFTFGEPVGNSLFNDKPCRTVIDVNFESQLDVDRVPPSTLLVHRLIFQFIEEQGSWKEAYPTQLQIPKMLHDFSLVVSRCRLLGDEIEFLSRWGPKYSLIKIAVNGNEVKLLFSSTASFAKFELTMSLSASYPMVPLPFTFQNRIGKISQDDVAAVLSRVPLGSNYLKTAVQLIHRDLLQGPPKGPLSPGEAPQ